jgi:hypothetical protein
LCGRLVAVSGCRAAALLSTDQRLRASSDGYFFNSIRIVRAIRLTDPAMAAEFGGYLRYANALPGEPDQASDFLLGPLLWLRCFMARRSEPADHLTSAPSCQHLGNLRVVPATTQLNGTADLALARGAYAASRLLRELYWGVGSAHGQLASRA